MTLHFSMSSAEVAPDAVQADHKLLHKEIHKISLWMKSQVREAET